MTRTVKLTTREPTKSMASEMRLEYVHGVEGPDQAVVMVYRAAHDAAPDDATKALEDLLIAVEAVYRGETFALPRLVAAREKVWSNPTCAALIRQAEERDDAGEWGRIG